MAKKHRLHRYAEDDDGEVADGESVYTSLEMMDSLQRAVRTGIHSHFQRVNAEYDRRDLADSMRRPATTWIDHQPHFATLTDEQRRIRNEARDAYIKRTCNAWKDAGRIKPADPDEDDDNGDDNDAEDARARYIARLQNAWRRPARMSVGAGPGVVGPSPGWVGPGPTTDRRRSLSFDEAKAMRDAAYREYCDRLYNAWRGG
jgi:hypothetical protein